MSDYLSFASVRASSLSLWIPLLGLWTADVTMVAGDVLPATGALVVGNLSLSGAVYRQASLGGVTRARLVGGAGGWGTVIGPAGYHASFGVQLSTVLGDAARQCGEQLTVAADRQIGVAFARPSEPGGSRLRAATGLAGVLWWVNASGVVTVGPRPTSSITSSYEVEDWDGGAGVLTVSTEDPASWQPGATFSNTFVQPTQTIAAVRHVLSGDGRARMRVVVT